jgi:hypothetical protein
LAEVAEVYNERYFESKTVFMQMLMLTPHCQTLSMENYKGKHVISLLKFASVRCLVNKLCSIIYIFKDYLQLFIIGITIIAVLE